GRWFGLAVRDSGGTLTRERIVDYLRRGEAVIEGKPSGAGLGLLCIARSATRMVFNLDPGRSTEVVALFDMEPTAQKGKIGARSLHVFRAAPKAVEAIPEMPPPQRSSGRGVWTVAALLLAAASSLGTLYYKEKLAPPVAAMLSGEELSRESTLTVYPDPSDAQVKLNGVVIEPGAPVRLDDSAM